MKKETTNIENSKTISFIKEVAKYFMNFLETDFKKRRIPQRNTIRNNRQGLKIGVDLEKYPRLKKDFFTLLNNGFKKENLLIREDEYTLNIPKNLFNLIEARIKNISEKDLGKTFDEIKNLIGERKILYAKEYDRFLEEAKEESKKIFSRNLIEPILDDLDKPLENLNMADENRKFQLEIDIIDSIFAIFENEFTEVLQSFFQDENGCDLKKDLQKIINLNEIQNDLVKFFESFITSDAFSDVNQLYSNNALLDKTEMYLYFYELSGGKDEKFPVFYIPTTITKEEDRFSFLFEKRVFVNKKAIDFVVQGFNLQTQGQSTLAGEFDRILYINEEDDFFSVLKSYIKKIENFFELKKNIDCQNSEFQKGINLVASFSNKSYLFVFDKSDEALINDYEEILNDDGDILEKFSSLLNGFIEKNPTAFMREVEDEWDHKDASQKLIFESPISLNDEQKQVLMALQKPDCNFMILEGPPGTGKSHTITAIICKALLEEKSVLVLSDKKEALDVVEDKISNTLNKIRHEENFRNPILRLGGTGGKLHKILQGQTISKIKDHYRAYKSEKSKYDKRREDLLRELGKDIEENIEYFEGISIKDIKLYFQSFDKFSNIDWLNSSEEYPINLLGIKTGIQKLSKHSNNLKIDKDLLSDAKFKLLNEYQNSLDALRESKIGFEKKNNNVDISKLIEEFGKRGPYSEGTLRSLVFIKTALSELSVLYKKKPVMLDLFEPRKEASLDALISLPEITKISLDLFFESRKFLGEKFTNNGIFSDFEIPADANLKKTITELREYVDNLNAIKIPIFGFLFKNKELEKAARGLRDFFSYFQIEKPQKYIKDIQQVSDLFEFIYKKISSEHKEQNSFACPIFRILIDLLRNNNNDEYLSCYQEIKNLQNKILEKQALIEKSEPALVGITDLEYEIQQVSWNIEVFKKTNNIDRIIHRLSGIIPDDIKIDKNENHGVFFGNNIKKSLNKLIKTVEELRALTDDIDFILRMKENYPNFAKKIKLNISTENVNESSSILSDYADREIEEYSKHKMLQLKIEEQFNAQSKDIFSNSINEIEHLTTMRMTYFLDKSITEYTEDCANEVQTLKNIVRRKQKFPKDLFENLKKAFPCILAGIRDYAEFIPLEKNLFDLVIIDEASQVSIAQALPALVRGRQIIVLGDDKQFSNVKANNASKVTNQELRTKVQDAFLEERLGGLDTNKNGWLAKVKENFDIKNSILKFSRFIRNYECQLKKHFRCYPEIISYSDKYFYDNTLQCMKIRGKQIDEVIKIEVIDHDGKFDKKRNTNELEVRYIIAKLQELQRKNINHSLGIITPHTAQAKFLYNEINNLPERDWLFGECKLKIMTFDSCQGEEKDYIFYSMVATREKDRLSYIFLKDFSSISDEEDGTTKSQRMNVGFSRAKECIHFVLSKPVEEFRGEIKNAMLHYQNELKNGKKKEGVVKKFDSKMEYKIDEIFHKTKFYKDHKETIEFIPQFELGKYLKQLNKNYSHPNYRVDFLLLFDGLNIVIEYDGFKEHFTDTEANEFNYEYYMKEDDVYRQKVLEGYGYKFLRINRFNIGHNPIETLDNRLQNLVKKNLNR